MTNRRIPAPKWSPELSRWTYPTFNMKGQLVWLTIPGDDTPPPASVTAKPYAGKILDSANKTWGFWGTIERSNPDGECHILPQEAWNIAFRLIASAYVISPEETRFVLDSRTGRHLADTFGQPTATIDGRAIRTHLVQQLALVGWDREIRACIAEIREG